MEDFRSLLADRGVQIYFLVLGGAISTCVSRFYHRSKPMKQKIQFKLPHLAPILSLLLIFVTWFYILRFILKHQFTSESYFDDAYKDVLNVEGLYFTSSQLLTWAVVAVVWTADEHLDIAYLIFGFLGAMSASFVLWIPTRGSDSKTVPKRRTVPVAYLVSSVASFCCILHLVPCTGQDCTPDQGFGSFYPHFRYWLQGLHILLLLPVFISRLLPIRQIEVDTAVLYGLTALAFSTWHLWQVWSEGRTFNIPKTDCQKSITIDLVACTFLTIYAVYRDTLQCKRQGTNERLVALKRASLAAFMVPIISPAAVLAAHLFASRIGVTHAVLVARLQQACAQRMRAANSKNAEKPSTSGGWCNLGLWTSSSTDYDQACERLALALANAAGMSSSDAVLSCGCGSGPELHLYKTRFQLRHITGIDPYLDVEETVSTGGNFNIRRIRTSVEKMKDCGRLATGMFNKILALDNVYHYQDKDQFFQDCIHLLPPGGNVAVTDLLLKSSAGPAPLWVRAALYLMGVSNLWTEAQYRGHLASAGFEHVEVKRIGIQVFCGWKHLLPESLLQYLDYATIVGTVAAGVKPKLSPQKKVAVIGSGLAGLAAAHAITSSSRASDISVTIYESANRPGLAGHSTLIGDQLVDVPARMAALGYYNGYMDLVNSLEIPFKVVKTDCTYHGKDSTGGNILYVYEKSNLLNLYNAVFVAGLKNLWKLVLAMSNIHKKDGQEVSTCVGVTNFGDWLHKHLDWRRNSKHSGFDLCSLLRHENQFLYVIIGSLGWMLSCTYDQLVKCPADIMLPYIRGLSVSKGLLGLFGKGEVVRIDPSIKALEQALLYGVDKVQCDTRVTDVDEKKIIDGVQYDAIICATEASAVPKVIKNASSVFEKFHYHPSTIYLHTDETLMPRDRRTWRTWSVQMTAGHDEPELTFWLNEFFPDATFEGNVFQTWAPVRPPQPELVLARFDFQRGVHTQATTELVAGVEAEQGKNGIYYAGSYVEYGMGLLEQATLSGKKTAEKVMEHLFNDS